MSDTFTYDLTFSASGLEDLDSAKQKIEDIDTAASNISDTPDLDLGIPEGQADEIAGAATAVGDLGTAVDSNQGKVSGFSGILQTFGLTSLGVSGAFDLISGALPTVIDFFGSFNDKAEETARITGDVNSALTDLLGLTDDLGGSLGDLNFDAINAAIVAGLDEDEVNKDITALGNLGLTYADLSSTLIALEADSFSAGDGVANFGGSIDTMAGILEGAGVEDHVDAIAEAVLALDSNDLSDFTARIAANLEQQGLSAGEAAVAAQELTDKYGEQILAAEQLNDRQENIDFEQLAEDQLALARGTDDATAALVRQAEADVGPDATDLEVFQRFLDLLNEASNTEVEVPVSADTEPAEDDIAEVTDGEHTTTVTAEGDTAPAREEVEALLTEEHPTTITADADTAQADVDIDAFTEPDRTVSTVLALSNGLAFDQLINSHTEDRTITVNMVIGSVPNFGAVVPDSIRIPIDYYVRSVPRIDGVRN